jgi:hypothetical protein
VIGGGVVVGVVGSGWWGRHGLHCGRQKPAEAEGERGRLCTIVFIALCLRMQANVVLVVSWNSRGL